MKYLLILLLVSSAYAGPFDTLRKTTVRINVGSGSIVKAKSGRLYIITNAHVCAAGSVNGYLQGSLPTGESFLGPIVKQNVSTDLCAAKVFKKTPYIDIAPLFKKKERLYSRGYPSGVVSETEGNYVGDEAWSYPVQPLAPCPPGSETLGAAKHPHGCLIHFNTAVTNLFSQPGSSGSPVVNEDGELVGVISSWLDNGIDPNRGGMVRYSDVKAFLEAL